MITCTREFHVDAAHRVLGHGGKCRHLHGHRYLFQVTCIAAKLNTLGMIIDFSSIKDIIGSFLEDNLDHNCILNSEDPLLSLSKEQQDLVFDHKQPYILSNRNPTAENLAQHLLEISNGLLQPYDIRVTQVRCYETERSWADAF